MVDTEALTRELVRHLRGERSQTALMRRLRYSSNVVYLWESGRRYPTLASLLWLSHRTGIDVHGALDRFQRTRTRDEGEPWTPGGAAALLRDLQGHNTAADIARHLDVSRHTVGRWMRGETEPRLPAALKLIAMCTHRMLDFVGLFADPAELPSTGESWAALQSARRLLREEPWSSAILLALELERYRALGTHQPGWLAERLGLTPELEARCLELLETSGQVVKREGLYVPTSVTSMNLAPRDSLDPRRWWMGVAVDRTLRGTECSANWNLFTVSREDYLKILEMQRGYFRGLRTVVNETKSMDHLVLATMQVMVLDDGWEG